jgi:hypothetical protein
MSKFRKKGDKPKSSWVVAVPVLWSGPVPPVNKLSFGILKSDLWERDCSKSRKATEFITGDKKVSFIRDT